MNVHRNEFAATIMNALASAHPDEPLSFDADEYAISVGNDRRLYLQQLYTEYSRTPVAERQECVRRIVISSCRRAEQIPDNYRDGKCDLLPRIRRRSQCETEKQGDHSVPYEPLAEDLGVQVVCDFPESCMTIDSEQMVAWGTEITEAVAAARENLRAIGFDMVKRERGVYVSSWHDGYDSSRLLVPEILLRCHVRGKLVAMPASRDVLVVTGSKDVRGLSEMVRMTEESLDGPRFLSGIPVVWDGTKWTRFIVSQGHPVSRALKALQFLTWAEDTASQAVLVRESLRQQGVERFVASTFVFEKCEPATACVWTDGIDPVLPMTEAVCFNRVTEAPDGSASVEIITIAPWVEVCRIMQDRMVALDFYPGWYSCEGFPTDSELAELRRRAYSLPALMERHQNRGV
ncbi:MAG: DUF1444 family protein [Pirellulaceae bacterium]